jgi:catechol 2,3-dioxygenase-like lactoylglutathione lyase family enzyme
MTILADAKPIVFVLTRDRAKAKTFYGDVLGLPLVAEDDFAATYDLGGVTMRLSTVENHVASPHTVLGWSVPDIRAAGRALKAQGAPFLIYEGFGQDADGVWTAPGGGVHVAWFHDPDGNVLSVTQAGPSA